MTNSPFFPEHPLYGECFLDWEKWRLTYESGKEFIWRYLRKFSERETDPEFECRRAMTYCPAFAQACVDEIKNSIYERLVDITRTGGTESYQRACAGEKGGVDNRMGSMVNFMGTKVLPELLTMKRVGIYVDMPPKRGEAVIDNVGLRPYLYIYRTEQIHNWIENSENQYESVLLEDQDFDIDPKTGFPTGYCTKTRRLWRDQDGLVHVEIKKDGEIIDEAILELDRIPLVMVEIPKSLLQSIADYQIALLNLCSSDIGSILRSNFPLLAQHEDARAMRSKFVRVGAEDDPDAKTEVVRPAGPSTGWYYTGDKAPQFIHPSPEPLQVSMAKQEQMKAEMRHLVALSVANLAPSKVSAASKELDSAGLQSGLSFIGLTLENIETQIEHIWAQYEGKKTNAKIKYPDNYTLKSFEERLSESDKFLNLAPRVASATFRKTVHKAAVSSLLASRIPQDVLAEIHREIDENAPIDSASILEDIEHDLVSTEYASELKGYPKGEAAKAAEQRAERAREIAEAQGIGKGMGDPGARGLPELSVNPQQAAKNEKSGSQKPVNTGNFRKAVRGEGKNNGKPSS